MRLCGKTEKKQANLQCRKNFSIFCLRLLTYDFLWCIMPSGCRVKAAACKRNSLSENLRPQPQRLRRYGCARLLKDVGRALFLCRKPFRNKKKRLSIARALVKKPELYIFDDSFSALDFKTDAALRRALAYETQNAAVLIIAQRVSTIRHAERIVVLNEGEPVGIGTHDELLMNCPVYKEIYESQTKEADEQHG